MELNAPASETHTPAGTVSATPAYCLLLCPQVHTQPAIQPYSCVQHFKLCAAQVLYEIVRTTQALNEEAIETITLA